METYGSLGSPSEYDVEGQNLCGNKLHGPMKEIRQGFIRKVYGILFVQLLITAAFSFMCMSIASLQKWITTDGLWLVISCAVIFLIISIVLSCCQSVARSFPKNYILLFLFTCCLSVMVGATTAATNPYIVTQAALCTVVVTLGLTLFAFQSKYDFTSWYGALLCITIAFVVFGILTLFFRQNKWMDIIYCSIGAFLFSVYIILDTQLIIGRGKLSLSEDDYIVAAMMLYLDIINLFLYIMRLLERTQNN
eukprot:GHVS01028330.1.p1 GENE.GHVS01028330.1~~GHVS01028330.1.p1  ORF type:complete len:250 (-),score=15.20 GHVS01028330.1:152-901(-)